MDGGSSQESEARFAAYVEALGAVLGHADRRQPAPFPPQDPLSPAGSRDLPFPRVTDPAAPPIRPERHIPNSIATVRRRLIVALARTLPRCPCCNASIRKVVRIPDY